MTHIRPKICLTIAGLILQGCGSVEDVLPPKPRSSPSPEAPELVLATETQVEQGEVEPGSYIVAFRTAPSANFGLFASFREEAHYHGVSLSDAYLTDPRIASMRYLTTVDLATGKDPAAKKPNFLPPALHLAWTDDDLDARPAVLSQVNFASPEAAHEVLGEWQLTGDIWFAEPNGLSELYQGTTSGSTGTEFGKAYRDTNIPWHEQIKLDPAIDKIASFSAPYNPVVAILDSGVDYEHPDLKERIWKRDNYTPNQAACGDDAFGCDTTQAERGQLGVGSPWPYLTTGPGQECPANSDPKKSANENAGEQGTCIHGTHVAGLVAARLNSAAGAGGACPWCLILPIKIITKGPKGKGTASDVAILAALKYLTFFSEKGRERSSIRIVNSSFGKYSRSRSVALLVKVLNSAPHNILVVGAASNEDSMKRAYPAALEEAICVASVDAQNGGPKSNFSNYGPWVDVSAPGSNGGGSGLMSTKPGGGHDLKQGTSMATPVVSGVAGLVLTINPELSARDLWSRIVETANPTIYSAQVPSNRSYYVPLRGDAVPTPLIGSGVVDAAAAVSGTKSDAVTARTQVRVDEGCGVVGGKPASGWTRLTEWVILWAPMLLFALRRLRVFKAAARN